jgi:hypothetical protein
MDAIGVQYGDIVQPSGTSVYSVRQVEGKFGSGIAIEDGTTNLIETQGGGASQDWTKWGHYGNTTYWTTSSQFDDPVMGKVFQGSNTGNAQAFLYDYYPYTFTSGGVYTNSIYLKSSIDLPALSLGSYINSSSGGQHNIANSVNFTGISTQWQRYEAVHTITQQANTVGGIGWSFGTLPSGCTIYASMPQLENKSFATSFVKGTRGIGSLSYPITSVNQNSGTISMWFNPKNLTLVGNGYPMLFRVANNIFELVLHSDRISINYNNLTPSSQLQTNTWYFLSYTWDNSVPTSTIYLYYPDGTLKTNVYSGSIPSLSGQSNMFIGCGGTGIYPCNSIISDVLIDTYAKSKDAIDSIFISNKPLYNPYDYRAYAY